MKTIGPTLYLERADMLRAGVGYGTIQKARKRGTKGYTVIADPADRRCILVKYDDLKPSVKCVVDALFGKAIKDAGKSDIQTLLELHPDDVRMLREHILPDGTSLPQEAQEKYARACSYIRLLADTPRSTHKRMGHATTHAWFTAVAACFLAEGIDLPGTYAPLRRKLREFAAVGAVAVVSGKWGNANRRIIQGEIEDFLISTYALPTKPDVEKVMLRYAEEAKGKGWPALSRDAVWTHLHRRPEVRRRWYLGRHGEKAWKAEFGHLLKRLPPTFRDAMWCSDGTKLNIFYQQKGGIAALMQVYVVMDVYSERILGWSLGCSENFRMQYEAMKMAFRFAQAKPLQMQYDNQSGHNKAESQDFFTRASKLHFPAMPRNPQSKPVESLIGRFQKEVMREDWAFTGQNITATRLDSRPNMEFIEAHRNELPTLEELPARVQRQIDQWNGRTHPHLSQSRDAAYAKSTNPRHIPLDILDMVELFWHTTAKPITYRKDGLTLQVGEQRHTFEVYDREGHPDEAFRRMYIGAKLYVKYDLDDFGQVMLYNEQMHCVAAAQAKQLVAMAVVDLRPGDRATIDHSLALRKRELANTWAELEDHNQRSGIDPETLVERAPYATIGKEELARAESILSTSPSPWEKGQGDEGDDDDDDTNPYAKL